MLILLSYLGWPPPRLTDPPRLDWPPGWTDPPPRLDWTPPRLDWPPPGWTDPPPPPSWTDPPRCGQTNKVKLLPSRRTTYAGGNNILNNFLQKHLHTGYLSTPLGSVRYIIHLLLHGIMLLNFIDVFRRIWNQTTRELTPLVGGSVPKQVPYLTYQIESLRSSTGSSFSFQCISMVMLASVSCADSKAVTLRVGIPNARITTMSIDLCTRKYTKRFIPTNGSITLTEPRPRQRQTYTETEKLGTGPNGIGLCLGLYLSLCVVCTVLHITIIVYNPFFIGLGLSHGQCDWAIMVSSHCTTPRTRTIPTPRTIRMGSTVICRTLHTAPTPITITICLTIQMGFKAIFSPLTPALAFPTTLSSTSSRHILIFIFT